MLGLVGKGITFDTGGISIKPAEGMERMKDDMAGGAAVIAAMRAIALLKPPIRVIGVVPTTENMPGGTRDQAGRRAHERERQDGRSHQHRRRRPPDPRRRLWYAREQGATHLVDVATLTGAVVVALGKITIGPVRHAGLRGSTSSTPTADRAGDRCWPLPLFDEYREQLKSDIADMINIGGRPGGAITAAMFLKDSPAACRGRTSTSPAPPGPTTRSRISRRAPTGVAVRTLAELAFTADRWMLTMPDSCRATSAAGCQALDCED